jgi:hypothetical protein
LNLDLEEIVMDITKRHAAMLSQGLWSLILERIVDRDLWDVEDVKLDNGGGYLTHLVLQLLTRVSPATGPGILLKAFSERWLRLTLNPLTGELHLGEANAVVGSRLEAKLAQASKIASFSPTKLMDNLLMTRSLVRRVHYIPPIKMN